MVVFLKCSNKFGERESAKERDLQLLWSQHFSASPDKACQLLVFSLIQTEKYDS